MASTIISDKGMILIPPEYRDRYGLRTGGRVHILDYGEVLALVPAASDPLTAGLGFLQGNGRSLTAAYLGSKEGSGRGNKK